MLTHASASKTALHSEEMLTLDAEPNLVKTQLKMLSHVQLMGVSRAVRALLAQVSHTCFKISDVISIL